MNILRKNIFFGALLMGAATFQVSGLFTAQAMRSSPSETFEKQSVKFPKTPSCLSMSEEGTEGRSAIEGYEGDEKTPDEARATNMQQQSSKIESLATTRGDHVVVGGKPYRQIVTEWVRAYGPRLLAAGAVVGLGYLGYSSFVEEVPVVAEPGMLDSAMGALSNGFGSVWGTLFGGSAVEM